MSEPEIQRRLGDLLLDPHESLEIEIKDWLDLRDNKEHQATLAKALMAIANHGGGFVIIGMSESDDGIFSSIQHPADLSCYSQDNVNGILHSYSDPPFHCSVHTIIKNAKFLHIAIEVPGGHRVPIRAKRDGPEKKIIQQHAIYIRRPGPRSEIPQSSREWDELLGRCLAAKQDEMLSMIRGVLTGSIGRAPDKEEVVPLDSWISECLDRWNSLTEKLKSDDPRRCPFGYYWFAYEVKGQNRRPTAGEMRDILERCTIRHTGWPLWWVPSRADIAPYIVDNVLECWLGRDDDRLFSDSAHADFWRVSPSGLTFVLRGFQEDGSRATEAGFPPGKAFDLTLPIWRCGEALLHAGRLAKEISPTANTVSFRGMYKGLLDREIVSLNKDRRIFGGHRSKQDVYSAEVIVDVSMIDSNINEIIHPFLLPLFELFSFFKLKPETVNQEIRKMRAHEY